MSTIISEAELENLINDKGAKMPNQSEIPEHLKQKIVDQFNNQWIQDDRFTDDVRKRVQLDCLRLGLPFVEPTPCDCIAKYGTHAPWCGSE